MKSMLATTGFRHFCLLKFMSPSSFILQSFIHVAQPVAPGGQCEQMSENYSMSLLNKKQFKITYVTVVFSQFKSVNRFSSVRFVSLNILPFYYLEHLEKQLKTPCNECFSLICDVLHFKQKLYGSIRYYGGKKIRTFHCRLNFKILTMLMKLKVWNITYEIYGW